MVIAHPHNINNDDVVCMKMLRICIKTDNPQPALALCEFAKMSGLRVSMNFTRASQINVNTLVEVATQCYLYRRLKWQFTPGTDITVGQCP